MDNMEKRNYNNLVCHICLKEFSSVFSKNRHLRTIHNEEMEQKNKRNIKCPLCSKEETFGCHNSLINHLKSIHSVSIKESFLSFRNMDEFETWRRLGNRDIDYTYERAGKGRNNEKYVYYNCNRGNSKGYISQCSKRNMKAGGSIKISGICPSRISARICNTEVTVTFIETHVGHEDELRSKHLTKNQQENIAAKLISGVSKERILQDARIIGSSKIERINILTRADLSYIIRKFNIDKRRDPDDMTATALKVHEWNSQGKNVFLFKQIGKDFPGLKAEDFALAYMNDIMEKKLLEFKRIICIDGTHGTNERDYDLTIVLIKDDRNIGFPVAFLLSNRQDQTIQRIFFDALKTRVGQNIEADYIMTDDDIKYFNAWCEVMDTQKKPRRLLCTWHVVKNWNTRGRNKLTKLVNKNEMKNRMRQILKETDIGKFHALKDDYFKHLEDEGEHIFLKYLQNYYFQSDERIMLWAHCQRINAGINTNMAIESLNRVIKYNKMGGRRNIRVEKLLDLLEELVNEKMWKKIVEAERPTANPYHCRITREAHIKAENILEKVIYLETGQFLVHSSSVSGKSYKVSCNELCDEDCRTVYCEKCEICIHRYKCECSEFAVKTALCKHIQAVALVEKRSESVSGSLIESHDDGKLYIALPTTSKSRYQTEVEDFVEDNIRRQENDVSIDSTLKNQIEYEQLINSISMDIRKLDYESLIKVKNLVRTLSGDVETNNAASISKKRKIEKQVYFPPKT